MEIYNQNIKKYNDYQISNNTLLRIRSYDTNKTYIDYDQDNHFEGKEE